MMIVIVTMYNPAARQNAARKCALRPRQVRAVEGDKGGRWPKPQEEGAGVTNACTHFRLGGAGNKKRASGAWVSWVWEEGRGKYGLGGLCKVRVRVRVRVRVKCRGGVQVEVRAMATKG